jgi:transposase-like protein
MTTSSPLELFKGRHFDQEIILLCVRWYLSFKLSSRDLVQMMTERGIVLAHTTILRWVQRYVPEFEKRWNRYARPVNGSWRCDETYIKVKGRWTYLYRAVDKYGQTVDFLLSERRDVAAAKCFLSKAMRHNGMPRVITLDTYAASHRAVRELKSEGSLSRRVRIRSSKYLNNVVEQDHRRVKQRTGPMLGFKRFDTATITISGIELAEKSRRLNSRRENWRVDRPQRRQSGWLFWPPKAIETTHNLRAASIIKNLHQNHLDYVPNQPRQKAVEYAISNGFGFGGTNAALVFAKYQIRR